MKLSMEQWQLIVNALMAVTPSGGGSAQYTLVRHIMHEQNLNEQSDIVGYLQKVAYDECKEYMAPGEG